MPLGIKDINPNQIINLFKNVPNPFKGSTKIILNLNQSTEARLQIIDITGRVITVLKDGYFNTGRHEIEWNGNLKNSLNGIYFCELITPEQKSVIKMVSY